MAKYLQYLFKQSSPFLFFLNLFSDISCFKNEFKRLCIYNPFYTSQNNYIYHQLYCSFAFFNNLLRFADHLYLKNETICDYDKIRNVKYVSRSQSTQLIPAKTKIQA